MNSTWKSRAAEDDTCESRNCVELFESANRFYCAMSLPGIEQLGILAMKVFTPRNLVQASFQVMQQAAAILKLVTLERDGQIAWDEFQNKLQAFYLFEHPDMALYISSDEMPSLPELVHTALQLEPYLAVWTTEGLGHFYTDLHLRRGKPFQALLCDDRAANLPAASLTPLHAGMGLSLAEWLLEAADKKNHSDSRIPLQTFIGLCRRNSRQEYVGATYEALGLAARNLYPQLMASVDVGLSQIDEEILAYFWHGVGRAIYFAPTNFLPYRSAPWKGWEMCLNEPPHKLGKHNAVAGFAWALTLVNLRQPEIMASFLKHHGRQLTESDAFANGVGSAIVIWRDSAPNDQFLNAFHRYQPDASLADLWDRYVKQSCDRALQYDSTVKTKNGIGGLFRYRPSAEHYSSN